MLLLELFQGGGVLGQPGFVDHRSARHGSVESRNQSDVTASDPLAKQLADLTLPPREGGRKLEIRTEEAMVDGPDLDGRSRVTNGAVGSPKPGHAGYHVRWAILRRDNEFVNSRNTI